MERTTPESNDGNHMKYEDQDQIPQIDKGEGDIIDENYAVNERSLVRKLDMTLMPMVFILYLLNYLDRNNIAQAKLDTIEEDLGLEGNEYNIAISILSIGYVLMQVPSNMLLTRVRPSIYIPLWVCIWSCLSAATAAVQNFAGLTAIRFFLGICEAPFFPGVFYLLSCWYTKKELALRYAVLYSGLVLATAFSGLLAAGIFAGLENKRGLAGWRWLFIIEGLVSLVFGLLAFFLLPGFVESETGSTKWLFTKYERHVAVERMRRDAISVEDDNHSLLRGLKASVIDPKVWLFALMLCANQTAYGFNYFYPSIVEGFDLGTRTITLVCTAPPYIVGAIVAYLIAWSSDRVGERGWHIALPIIVATVGFIISVSVLSIPARYCASFLYISGVFGANATLYGWAASSVSSTPEKKACATAIINVIGQFGSIWSPYFFNSNDAPRYTTAMLLLMAFCVLEALLCFAMKFLLRKENKKILERFDGYGAAPNLYTL
ncbi:hypothetical protein N7541_004752 [Penicillium brevicompactum]|uniref:Major facilitator superfamily (MFS) profile domain-containing protein n=1 Tax=Penicillium brevicompactum TaxID=5074 RepID=A0A9W9UV10_PENBR|nr:hypothetical protein N7541_004752 [Penicillium brevicompactum]